MKWTRRDVLKGLGALPIVGGVWWAGAASSSLSSKEREAILAQLNIDPSLPAALPPIGGEPIRVGIIGFGIRLYNRYMPQRTFLYNILCGFKT